MKNQRICRPTADRFTFNHTVKLWDSREMFGKPRGNVWDRCLGIFFGVVKAIYMFVACRVDDILGLP